GSNLLIRSDVVPGLVIHLVQPSFAEIRIQGERVTAGAGAKLGHVISSSVREGLAGLETLVGIPGTIGGGLRGNAGGRSGDIGQWTCRATLMTRDGEILERSDDELVFAYRQSNLDELVILSGEFKLVPDDPAELTKRMQKLWIVKKANQPLSHQSAGCIFKNPRGMSAGMLIDQAGLKGNRIGGAEVSDRHANFIIADADATSQQVLQLIELIKERVADKMGVELETEIEIW
ncbi:MAG: UDP-N-acetylmuramate dehydrogenase, partial [Planctomycetaceae bacterium]|nr:UDP-N-acetylmuramate dehydrogenase [Planctomycetaceae bacterium]